MNMNSMRVGRCYLIFASMEEVCSAEPGDVDQFSHREYWLEASRNQNSKVGVNLNPRFGG